MSSRYNLAAGLAHKAITAPDAIALNVGGCELSYRDLAPQNINGKIDRNALIRMLDHGEIAAPPVNAE